MTKKIELSSTIHLLGEILGSVIKKQENTAIFDKIEKIRTLSKNSRGSNESLNNQSFKKLKNQISNLTSTETLIIAKSFSRFLDFSNIAESLYSIHNIHDHVIRKTQETNEIVILEEALLDIEPTNEHKISFLTSLINLLSIGEHISGIGTPPPLPPASKLIVLSGNFSFTASSCCDTVKYFLPLGK